jgi:hypothetical protein
MSLPGMDAFTITLSTDVHTHFVGPRSRIGLRRLLASPLMIRGITGVRVRKLALIDSFDLVHHLDHQIVHGSADLIIALRDIRFV